MNRNKKNVTNRNAPTLDFAFSWVWLYHVQGFMILLEPMIAYTDTVANYKQPLFF